MKIGDYVRTISGIDKITRIEKSKDIIFCNDTIYCEHITIPHWRNYKSSPNIIDLIEVGDIVNGYKITTIGSNKIYAEDEEGYLIKEFAEKNIKSILTHEQYEMGAYKVNE